MSTTEIYKIGSPDSGEIGEVKNAWRGAMYVWNDIAKRYCGLESFPLMGEKQNEVWNAWQRDDMPRHEKIVLLSTMDNAVISHLSVNEAIQAFEKYGAEHPNSSLSEQANIMKSCDIKEGEYIGFCQTSVSDFWGIEEWNDDGCVFYNPNVSDKHFEVLSYL